MKIKKERKARTLQTSLYICLDFFAKSSLKRFGKNFAIFLTPDTYNNQHMIFMFHIFVTHNVFTSKHLSGLAKMCARISQCPGNVYQKAVMKTLQRFTGKRMRWNTSILKSQVINLLLQYKKTSSKILPDQFSGCHHLTGLLKYIYSSIS